MFPARSPAPSEAQPGRRFLSAPSRSEGPASKCRPPFAASLGPHQAGRLRALPASPSSVKAAPGSVAERSLSKPLGGVPIGFCGPLTSRERGLESASPPGGFDVLTIVENGRDPSHHLALLTWPLEPARPNNYDDDDKGASLLSSAAAATLPPPLLWAGGCHLLARVAHYPPRGEINLGPDWPN